VEISLSISIAVYQQVDGKFEPLFLALAQRISRTLEVQVPFPIEVRKQIVLEERVFVPFAFNVEKPHEIDVAVKESVALGFGIEIPFDVQIKNGILEQERLDVEVCYAEHFGKPICFIVQTEITEPVSVEIG